VSRLKIALSRKGPGDSNIRNPEERYLQFEQLVTSSSTVYDENNEKIVKAVKVLRKYVYKKYTIDWVLRAVCFLYEIVAYKSLRDSVAIACKGYLMWDRFVKHGGYLSVNYLSEDQRLVIAKEAEHAEVDQCKTEPYPFDQSTFDDALFETLKVLKPVIAECNKSFT
jgi:hypothetical protein